MTPEEVLVAALEDLGLPPELVEAVVALAEKSAQARAIPYSAEFLRRVFLRVDRDSAHGRALSRALGFTDDVSLERAARDFCVSKQYLHRVQGELRAKLGDLAPRIAGPSGGPLPQRNTASQAFSRET